MPSLVIIYSTISILPNFIRLQAPSYPNLDKYYTIYTHTTQAIQELSFYAPCERPEENSNYRQNTFI